MDQAFGLAAQNMATVFGGKFSVDTLESVNARMGQDAARFLSDLPTPPVKAFTRHRLTRILEGDVAGVVRGLRATLTRRKLRGGQRKQLQAICNYLAAHAARMRYDEYLLAGYPIASGVIEGACRHLVKDRMERSGMRWSLEGARNMLNVRAAFQSSYWDQLQHSRIVSEQLVLHPHRELLGDYHRG
ncbi:MAG: hypothetical protein ACREJM_12270 [Candidatus Saccharimonadales bacterium]